MVFNKYSGQDVLTQIPGVTSLDVQTWLYWARRLSSSEQTHRDICHYKQPGTFLWNPSPGHRPHHQNERSKSTPDGSNNTNRMLLWHGAPTTNKILSILQHSFQLPEDNNQMFGTGIYFADRASKSANYSTTRANNKPVITFGEIGYMFLCDVSVGSMYNTQKVRHLATSPPTYIRNGHEVICDSVKCTGEFVPDRKGEKRFQMIEGGADFSIPYGKTIKNPNLKYKNFTVRYNEFVVYRQDRCKLNH